MAAQWSENYVSVDFGDVQASAMAVDCLGNWAVLAGRRVLGLVDLDNPQERCHRVTRQSKWDITCVQWNPHASHAHLFCTTSSQRLDLFSWKDANTIQVSSMKGHSRNISDVDWSPFDVNVIATCSTDSYTHLWDVRDSKKPVSSFQTVAGASQVKWNKVTNNCFATTHEGDVRIWDPRKGNSPVLYMAAHLSKINGLDWSPTNEYHFATSSQDCTVKFWDYTNHRHNKGMLNSGSPVWRARFTPFGHGLVTVVLSTLRRGENSLYLWNNDTLVQPVHQFVGHSDVVLEFQWRKKAEENRDYHLVTWSKDQSLRIWRIDPQLQRLCGHDTQDSSENESTAVEGVDVATEIVASSQRSADSISKTDQSELASHQQPMTLMQEFSLVNRYIPNVTMETMDLNQRTCSVTVVSGKYSVTLTLHFPTNYPHAAAPTFDISPSLAVGMEKKLRKVLTETSQKHVKRNINCLEPCLRQFSAAFENMTMEERKTPDSDTYSMNPGGGKLQHSFLQAFSAFQDSAIPFPRTCGATFCSTGQLVCFGRSKEANKGPQGSEVTPKALSELTMYSSTARVRSSQSSSGFPALFSRSPPTQKTEPVSISSYYMPKERRQRTKSRIPSDKFEPRMKDPEKSVKNSKKSIKLDPVRVYDVSCLLTIHKYLAENYILDLNDVTKMCQHNTNAALAVGRRDLVRLWSLVSVMSHPSLKPGPTPEDGAPWAKHPFGRQMLESLLQYYSSMFDVQSLAILCCVFWRRQYQTVPSDIKRSSSKSSIDYVPPNTDANLTNLLGSSTDSGWNLLQMRRATVDDTEVGVKKRANSWSFEDFSLEDYRFADEIDPKEKVAESERKMHENYSSLLDQNKYPQYDQYMRAYADILYRWGLRTQATEILKYVTIPPEPHTGIEFGVQCHYCKAEVRGAKCPTCKSKAFRCVICHTGVTGASNFCLLCGHGGHASHMVAWFKTEAQCPTGCGCQCLTGQPF